MTEINIPTCERCGTPKAFPETDLGCPLCPLPESACRSIAALRSENEALRKRNEELEKESAEWAKVAVSQNDGFTPRIIEDGNRRYRVLASNEAWRCLESRAQEAETKLRAAEDQVVVLREVIDDFFNYQGGSEDPRQDDHLMDRAVDALTDTQALANQRVEAIRREAASELMQALRDYGQHQRAIPELGVKGCDYDPEEGIPCTCGLAAILGEKENQ